MVIQRESRGIADVKVEHAKPYQEPTPNIVATPAMPIVPSVRTVRVRSKPIWKITCRNTFVLV